MAQQSIALDSIAAMPPALRKVMKPLRDDFLRHHHVDSFARRPAARDVMTKLAAYLDERGVIGIHYTRAEREDIATGGLICGAGAIRRTWFLERYGNRFSPGEIKAIKAGWRKRYDAHENSIRDHRVFFNLTSQALTSGGAEPLLKNFGGETIFMGLLDLPEIMAKMRTLGSPLIVKCRLQPSRLVSIWERPAALVWLSAYHATVNREAALYDVDVHTTASLPRSDIISVELATVW